MFKLPFGWGTKRTAPTLSESEIYDEMTKRREKFKRKELEFKIGQPLIMIGNEWDDPVIGFGHSVGDWGPNSPILLIDDYITGRRIMGLGVIMDYSHQKFEALLKLDPYERWAFTAHNAVGNYDVDKEKRGMASSAEELRAMRDASGFTERFNSFLMHEQIAEENRRMMDRAAAGMT